MLIGFVLVVLSVTSVRRSRIGRALLATRDNPRAAQAYGVSPIMARLFAFAFSGFIAAFAGAFYVWHQHGPSGTVYDPLYSIRLLAMGVIGGLGSIPGALMGAGFQTFLDYSSFTRNPYSRLFSSGVGLLIVLLIIPNGLSGVLYSVRDNLLRRVARRRNIVVPSLVADILVADDGVTVVGMVEKEDKKADDESRSLIDAIFPVRVLVQQALSRVRALRGGGEDEDTAPIRGLPRGDNKPCVRGLDVAYGKTQVLFGVNFHVRRGEIVALLGPNGAGKSTLLSAISGLVPPSAGTVLFDGEDLTGAAPLATVTNGIVMVPGGKGVFPTLTVEENLRLAAWIYARDGEYVAQATEQVLEYFPILRSRWDQKAGNLSGGEQQMLTLAQAFIAKPRLLMIDELSLGLAPISSSSCSDREGGSTTTAPPSSSSSSRSTSPSRSRSAPCSWRRARCASTGPRPSCSTAPTCCTRYSSREPPQHEAAAATRHSRRATAIDPSSRPLASTAAASIPSPLRSWTSA